MIISGSVEHACTSIIIASSILMYLGITLAEYLAFNNCVTSWSISCVTEVVLGGKKMISVLINAGTSVWAGQLLTMNATLSFWARNFQSKSFIQYVKISVFIQLFGCAFYWHSKDLTFLNYLRFLLFPMRSNSSFSPVALVVHIQVSLTLLGLPSIPVSPFNSRVLLGSAWKKRLNSSAVKISSNLYLDNSGWQMTFLAGCSHSW